MTVLGLVVLLIVLALLYWGVNTAPFIIGSFRAILSWFLVAVAVVLIVVFILQVLGITIGNGAHVGNVRLW
jgi:hypothetical protein